MRKAYITLTTVIILSVVAGIIVTTALTLSTDSAASLTVLQNNKAAKATANSCVEVVLESLKTSLTYTGKKNLLIGSETCTIVSVLGSGNTNRTIQTQSTVGDATVKLEVFINTVNPITDIESWQEVDDF